jgi:hypothetical protein
MASKKQKLNTIKSSIQGIFHRQKNERCQDYVNHEFICEGKILIAAMSDGLGSQKHSHEGSKIAVEEAILGIKDVLEFNSNTLSEFVNDEEKVKILSTYVVNRIQYKIQKYSKLLDTNRLPVKAIYRLRKPITAKLSTQCFSYYCLTMLNPVDAKGANKYFLRRFNNVIQNNSGKERDCTLLLIVIADNFTIAMQIGDGTIVIKNTDEKEYHILFDSDVDGFDHNKTLTIMNPDLRVTKDYVPILNSGVFTRRSSQIQIYMSDQSPDFICMSTDGMNDFIIDDMQDFRWILNQAFFEYIDSLMKSKDGSCCKSYIDRILRNNECEWGKKSNDDITTLIIRKD